MCMISRFGRYANIQTKEKIAVKIRNIQIYRKFMSINGFQLINFVKMLVILFIESTLPVLTSQSKKSRAKNNFFFFKFIFIIVAFSFIFLYFFSLSFPLFFVQIFHFYVNVEPESSLKLDQQKKRETDWLDVNLLNQMDHFMKDLICSFLT